MSRAETLAYIRKARGVRASQVKHRGSKRSIATDFEDALLFLAWEGALLSEGQMAAILDIDRVTLRKKREAFLDRAMLIAEALNRRTP